MVMMDPSQVKAQVIETIHTKLAPTEAQWKTLLPLIEKVQDAQRNARTGAGMSFNSPPMVNGKAVTGSMRVQSGGGATVDTPAGQAMQSIRNALSGDTNDDELRKRIAALHEARDLARVDLIAAQDALRQACTPRQEATLMTLAILD
jgi:hypothetical protein